MEDKTKYYIFDRKEIALVFAFIISIAITAFLIGVKVGSDYSYQMSDLTPAEKSKVDLLSSEEEEVTQLIDNNQQKQPAATTNQGNPEVLDAAYEKLKKEFAKLDENPTTEAKNPITEVIEKDQEKDKDKVQEKKNNVDAVATVPVMEAASSENPLDTPEYNPASDYKKSELRGKFTIQIGSHRSCPEAEKFASGFRARGYQPIINEVELAGGIWFRVSLGVFSTIADAKNYIAKEQALFQGQDYIIYKFD